MTATCSNATCPTVELVLDDANASRFTQKRRRDSDNLTPRRGTEFNATPPPTTMGDRGTPPSSRYAAEIAAIRKYIQIKFVLLAISLCIISD